VDVFALFFPVLGPLVSRARLAVAATVEKLRVLARSG
jgi:hypothetical protein